MVTTRKKIISNIITIALIGLTIAMLVRPNFKAMVISGLMKIGLFQPGVSKKENKPGLDPQYNVQFTTSDGKTYTNETLKGKVVFINFWATWCPPCIAEMPTIARLQASFKNNPDIVFLLADADKDLPKATDFLKEREMDLPVTISNGEIPPGWYKGTLPTTVVLDKQGNMVFQHEGVADYNSKKFKTFLKDLLK